jgi:hypothetical protein
MENVSVSCIVCGLGSTRSDWQSHPAPACDGHSKDEIQAAMTSKQPPPSPAAPKPVAKPLVSAKTVVTPPPPTSPASPVQTSDQLPAPTEPTATV